ncbi:hypothetical protein ATE92_2222 [Ulvibacter sp. MAR_2010_11]|uniref:hypothetical protein n=1 Tax=Ulvibacter sp. MAR_2010_11 TaxID=1250229 RepID=UPI000C2BB636|nr:hypothetical protein [Ulvibacter sp. MAR_2010_11]PKA84052.1 hypothetical protein ATE92_2222 [Ulvibacter sp. MAR_2010_11]
MTETSADNGKTVGIIAYVFLIGWIIALVMHNGNKTEYGAFHIRQMLGIMIVGFALYLLNVALIFAINIGILSWIIQIAMLVFWLLGFIGAIQGEKKLVPLLGAQFQEWFKGVA